MTFIPITKEHYVANLPEGKTLVHTFIYDSRYDRNGNRVILARFIIIENGKDLVDLTKTITNLTSGRLKEDKRGNKFYRAQFNDISILEDEINQNLKRLGSTKEVRLSIA